MNATTWHDGTIMSLAEPATANSVVAVYPDHFAAERAVRQLHEAGFDLGEISIVGRNYQEIDEPYGLVGWADYARVGAEAGSLFGGLLGLCVGAAFLFLPEIGFVVVAGPIAAALLAGIEGAVAGLGLGSVAGALVGWDIPKDRALKYETQIKGGKFLVFVRSVPEVVARARGLLVSHGPDQIDVYTPPSF